jgi:uncharacterized membrane protein HdeD (DUF308 family)
MNDNSTENWLSSRQRNLWKWSALGLLMLLLQLAFILWLAINFDYLSGCWEIMLSLEGSALQVSPQQRLSLMMPLWVGLGALTYSLAMVAVLRFRTMEKRYLRLLREDTRDP